MKKVVLAMLMIVAIISSCDDSETIPSVESNPEFTTDLIGSVGEVYLNDILGQWTVTEEYLTDDKRYNRQEVSGRVGASFVVSEASAPSGNIQRGVISFQGSSYVGQTIKMNTPFFNRIALLSDVSSTINQFNGQDISEGAPVQTYSGMYLNGDKLEILSQNLDGTYLTLVLSR